ncbi:MAG: transcriptional antiterminator, Rof [Gammaproteobacteria bacterium]|nr:transcriptional antiterminator, Rof [Gammaproteobacteria bacterium]MDH5777186.1 transcriptional antiterminator, Rof [Gammaproteobacteria bacterium]
MNKDDTSYQPVSCDIHSEYELAIMHKKHLTLCWDDHGQIISANVLPLDLITREKQEFLLVKDENDKRLEIRLDHIRK